MSTAVQTPIEYPSSDGQPMAENCEHANWGKTIHDKLAEVFRDDSNVVVAMNHFWYPVEEQPDVRQALDVYVVFGRPQGHRAAWVQWSEEYVSPQVVFQIALPGKRLDKFKRLWPRYNFYSRYGVDEFYHYDPESGEFDGFRREGDELVEIPEIDGYTSPRLGVIFALDGTRLQLLGPHPQPLVVVETSPEAKRRIEDDRLALRHALQRADRLAAKLRELGVNPDQL